MQVDAGGATTGLAGIPRPAPGVSSKKSEVLFDLRAGIDKPAKLQITTFYRGRLADAERLDPGATNRIHGSSAQLTPAGRPVGAPSLTVSDAILR